MSRNTNRQDDVQPDVELEQPEEFPSAAADGNDAEAYTIQDAKVGDSIQIPGSAPAAMVRLPDGSVATVRGSYTVRHQGEHAIVLAMDGATTEVTFNVEAGE